MIILKSNIQSNIINYKVDTEDAEDVYFFRKVLHKIYLE